LAPLVIRGGALRGMEHHLHVASAQVKSAILLAGLYAEGETMVWEPAPSRDHTERMLGVIGAPIRLLEGGVAICQASGLRPLRLRIPGDFSAAAFFLVAALVHPDAQVRLEGVGLNPTRTGLLEVLAQMGAQIQVENVREWGPEPVADLVASSSRLEAVQVEGDMVPRMIDEVPLLAVAACFAHGETVIRGAQELRTKESDRLQAMARELRRMGARVEELPDGLRIWGPARLQGAAVDSHGDHRLAMALAVAALAARGETVIRNAQSVVVSYPNFWDDLRAVARI
jgi:3-phosphoshikimate 1-carboxyvinyltransferase